MKSSGALWHNQEIAILVIVVVVAVLLVLFFWRGGARSDEGSQTPEQILKARYAKGEVDDSAYERMLKELRK